MRVPRKESSQTSRCFNQHLNGRRAWPRVRQAGRQPVNQQQGKPEAVLGGGRAQPGLKGGSSWSPEKARGAPPASAHRSRRHFPCPVSGGQSSLPRTYAQQVTEPVCCFQRQESYFLWLQLCPVENQASGHGLLLLSARGGLGGTQPGPSP